MGGCAGYMKLSPAQRAVQDNVETAQAAWWAAHPYAKASGGKRRTRRRTKRRIKRRTKRKGRK
jgi:hypothetical protein